MISLYTGRSREKDKMARIPPIDTCILCDQNPCVCYSVLNKNTRAKKLLKPIVDVVKDLPASNTDSADSLDRLAGSAAPAKKLSHISAMKAAAAAAPPPAPPKHTRPEPIKHKVSEEDVILQAGIRAVAPLLHPDSRKEYAAIIGSEPSPEERKILWKARRMQNELDSTAGKTND